jgi:hypothetical protein
MSGTQAKIFLFSMHLLSILFITGNLMVELDFCVRTIHFLAGSPKANQFYWCCDVVFQTQALTDLKISIQKAHTQQITFHTVLEIPRGGTR